MIRLAINGALGRMGREIFALSLDDERFKVVGGIEIEGHSAIGKDYGIATGMKRIGIPISKNCSGFDVLIDFSTPEGTLKAVELALKNRATLVSGTTDLDEAHHRRFREVSKEIGLFWSSNFSRGIAALSDISAKLARIFEDADIEIIEQHHRDKADSPSGTAYKIAERIAESRQITIEDNVEFGRKGRTGPRKKGEIGIHSIRGGGIIGDHSVLFATPFENLIIEHRAISRHLFAHGALAAAAFIYGKVGYFDMNDIINLH